MEFSKKLQKLRVDKNMSQEDLAEQLNVSRQSVSKWESGAAYPETDKLIVLSELFDVSLDYFLKDETPQTIKEVKYPSSFRKHYHYTSPRKLFGLPLVHVNVGSNSCKAKGIVAIGNQSVGVLSIGVASAGVVSMGVATAGVVSIGATSFGLLAAAGAVSIGYYSLGAIAIGMYAIGAIAVGAFSYGAVAVASHIAIGKVARGAIAIGENVKGTHVIQVERISNVFHDVSRAEVSTLVSNSFTGFFKSLAQFVVRLF